MNENYFDNLKRERSNINLMNKTAIFEKEKSKNNINNRSKSKQKEKEKQDFSPLYDIMKMSEFLNEHIKNLDQDFQNESKEIRHVNSKQEENDSKLLDVIKDFKREKLLDNEVFFYNGKEFIKNNNKQKVQKRIKSMKNNFAEKHIIAYNLNPITKCQIDFSDDENSDMNHNSDIDIYLED